MKGKIYWDLSERKRSVYGIPSCKEDYCTLRLLSSGLWFKGSIYVVVFNLLLNIFIPIVSAGLKLLFNSSRDAMSPTKSLYKVQLFNKMVIVSLFTSYSKAIMVILMRVIEMIIKVMRLKVIIFKKLVELPLLTVFIRA